MTDIINANPTDILENFRNAYYDQIGFRMQMGSEEYMLSSVFSYALAHYGSLINQSYKNQVLETASGEFLDNIGKRYGLTRTPDVFSNPWFEGYFVFDANSNLYTDPEHADHVYDIGELEIHIGDYVFTNNAEVDITLIRVDPLNPHFGYVPVKCRFVCTHSDLLPYDNPQFRDVYINAIDADGNLVFDPITANYSHLIYLVQAKGELNDGEFRKYIEENKYRYCPGLAGSYESIAKLSTPYITDARCRVQGDAGFRPGYVDVYVRPKYFISDIQNELMQRLVREQDLEPIRLNCINNNIVTIGQTPEVYIASPIIDKRYYTFYIEPEYESATNEHLYKLKFNASLGYLNNHLRVGERYIASKVVQIMKQDLSTLSTDLSDFGIVDENSEAYTLFNTYCKLPVLGTAVAQGQVSNTNVLNEAGAQELFAHQYIILIPPTAEQMDIPPQYTITNGIKMYSYNFAEFKVLDGVR